MRNNGLKEKVAYLRGLTKGLNLNESSAEGKLLVNIVDVLDSFAQEVKSVNLAQLELEEYVESIDGDLSHLEDELYSDEEAEYNRYTADGAQEEWVEMSCPNCRELVSFEADILDEDDEVEVTCPYCREIVYDNTIDLIEDIPALSGSGRRAERTGHPGI